MEIVYVKGGFIGTIVQSSVVLVIGYEVIIGEDRAKMRVQVLVDGVHSIEFLFHGLIRKIRKSMMLKLVIHITLELMLNVAMDGGMEFIMDTGKPIPFVVPTPDVFIYIFVTEGAIITIII